MSHGLSRFIAPAVVLGALLAFGGSGAQARGFAVTFLVGPGVNRPDTGTPFIIVGTPAIDGKRVAFMTKAGELGAPLDAVWSIDIASKALTKIAGTDTPVPGGAGNFSSFSTPFPTAGGGRVAFFGFDASNVRGLYTARLGGGSLHRIATIGGPAPDASTFDDLQDASLNGSDIVFYGHTAAGHHGVYRATVAGDGLAAVIDEQTILSSRKKCGEAGDNFYNYARPVIGLSEVTFFAQGGGDSSIFPSALFQSGPGGFADIADNLTRLQGDPGKCPHDTFDQKSAQLQTNQVAFRSVNAKNGFAGIFLANGAGTTASRFASTGQAVPGGATSFTSFAGLGYDETGLAFTATDTDGTVGVYFVEAPGERIDRIAVHPTYYFPNVGDRSISKGRVTFADGTNTFGESVWVAQ